MLHTNFKRKARPIPIVFNEKDNSPPTCKKIKLDVIKRNFQNSISKPKLGLAGLLKQREKLPVYQHRRQLLELIKQYNTLIILGETGSGKTTQIPQLIYAARLQDKGTIGITQPRRVAAITVAKRVNQEMGNALIGELVGYCVRFEDATSEKTKIKFLTDGMLVKEAIYDKLLLHYSFIILDEAHERSIQTDVAFGIVKNAQKARENGHFPPLKVIIMSATMDVDHFSSYFNNCPVVYLEGRTWPVKIFHTVEPWEDYTSACVNAFFKIHRVAPPNHDVLIFLTGQEEIETVAHQIRLASRSLQGIPVRVCTLYAAQPTIQQLSVFQAAPENTRKVIISTNIAETSVTISGIKYVIDSGRVKNRIFQPTTCLETLEVQRISREQAWQRAGRAGRESEGFCYRLYTRLEFDRMQPKCVPEIQRADLSLVCLQLLVIGIHAANFDFMDKPSRESLTSAFAQLKTLGAIEDVNTNVLTQLGKKMAKFPLNPRFSLILLSANKFGCLQEVLTIISLLTGESVLLNPPSRREDAQNARQKFNSPYGDHITLLNIYREFCNVGPDNRRSWCHEHFINVRNMLVSRSIREQLIEICKKCGITVTSCGSQMDQVRKCLLTGLFMNVAELHRDRQYITLDSRQTVKIHPSSVLHGQLPHYVLFTELVRTSKCFIREISTVEKDWLLELAPDYVKNRNIKFFNES